jgi:hypothetical protein
MIRNLHSAVALCRIQFLPRSRHCLKSSKTFWIVPWQSPRVHACRQTIAMDRHA